MIDNDQRLLMTIFGFEWWYGGLFDSTVEASTIRRITPFKFGFKIVYANSDLKSGTVYVDSITWPTNFFQQPIKVNWIDFCPRK